MLSISLFFSASFPGAQAQEVPTLNHVRFDEETGDVIFVAVGHVYGRPETPTLPYSEYPAATLLANKGKFLDPSIDFVMLLGDIVHKSNEKQFQLLSSSLLNDIPRPVLNAPGNHELQNRELYTERFGKTFFTFQYGSALFVVLDGELDHGLLVDEQKQMFFESLRRVQTEDAIRFLVIFSHKVLWDGRYFAGSLAEREAVQKQLTQSILPAFSNIPDSKYILWFSGDYIFPLVHEEGSRSNMHFFTLGLREDETDIVLRVTLPVAGGEPMFQPLSLSESPMYDIATYTENFWFDYYRKHYPNPGGATNPYWLLQQPQNRSSFLKNIFYDVSSLFVFMIGVTLGALVFCLVMLMCYRGSYYKRRKDKFGE